MSWTLNLNINSTVQSVPFPMVYLPMQLSMDKLSQKAESEAEEPPKGQGFKINLTVE